MLPSQIVTVFGGSGFVGRAIIAHLARAGFTVRIATRRPAACYQLKTLGTPGQIVPQFYDPGRPETIGAAINGSYAVINAVGILYERRRSTFHAAHVELPRQIATACKRYNVQRLVHLSALGVEVGHSKYARSKLQGEQTIADIFPAAAILRPSVIFGAGDNFINLFARLSVLLPFLPLIGGGTTRFQPVYVDDVGEAACRLVTTRAADLLGQIYELGGPEILTFRDILNRLARHTGLKRPLIRIPWGLARVQAFFLERFPKPLLTADQLRALETDSVISPGAKTFRDLSLSPQRIDDILPRYLGRYRQGAPAAEAAHA